MTGAIINDRQQLSAGFSISSDDTRQMIPTPGFNNSANADVYQSHRNEENSRDGGKLLAVGSDFGNPSQLQRQRPASSNDHMHRNLGHQVGGGFRPNMHQNASGMINIPQNAGVGMGRNSVHLANEPRSSEGVLSSTHFSTLSQPLQQPVDQLQVSHMHSKSL